MRRIFAVFALFFLTVSFAQAKETADVVVLLDTSESMFPYFEQVVDYIVTKVARDYLRQDDTFHLLTFSDTAQLELAQGIQTEEDVRSLISRLYLVYPFGKNTDLISAINYLQQYASDLASRNDKMIVIITDGIHNPSDKSPYSGYTEEGAMSAIVETAGKIAQNGWKVSIIRIPFDPNDATASKDKGVIDADKLMKGLQDTLKVESVTFDPNSPDSVAQTAMALPVLEFPADLGKKDSSFSFSVKVDNTTPESLNLELREVISSGENIINGKSFLKLGKGKKGVLNVKVSVPDSLKDGAVQLPIRLIFADSVRVSPSSGVVSFTLHRSATMTFWKESAWKLAVGFLAIAFIALIILIILNSRHMPAKSSATVVDAVKSADEGVRARAGGASYQSPGRYQRASTGAAELTVASGSLSDKSAKATRVSSSPEIRDLGFVPTDNNGIKVSLADDAMKRANKPVFAVDAKVSPASRGGFALPVEEKKKDSQLRNERRAFDEAADREGSQHAESILSQLKVKKSGSIIVQLSVDKQNPNIGLRNVHSLKSGSRLSIGGGKSSPFTVFVVKVPRRLAELYFDGETCHLVPVRRDYFPDLKETMIDCLDKDVAIETPEGFRMNLRLSRWENPTDRLNKLLHIIDIRGLV